MCVVHHASIGLSEAVPLSELVAIAEDPEVDTNSFEESMRFDADKLEVDTILLDCICIIGADSTDLLIVCFEAPSKVTCEFFGENPLTNCKRTTIRQTIKRNANRSRRIPIFLVIVSFFFNIVADISHLEFICCILCVVCSWKHSGDSSSEFLRLSTLCFSFRHALRFRF